MLISLRNNKKLLARVKAFDRHANMVLENVKEVGIGGEGLGVSELVQCMEVLDGLSAVVDAAEWAQPGWMPCSGIAGMDALECGMQQS